MSMFSDQKCLGGKRNRLLEAECRHRYAGWSKANSVKMSWILIFHLIRFSQLGLVSLCLKMKGRRKMRRIIAGSVSLSHFATDGEALSATREILSLQANTWTKFWMLAIFKCANPKVRIHHCCKHAALSWESVLSPCCVRERVSLHYYV